MPPYLTPDARDLIRKLLKVILFWYIIYFLCIVYIFVLSYLFKINLHYNYSIIFIFIIFQRQVQQRLGSAASDSEAIKNHQFFKHINWADVLSRKLEPPIKPCLVSFLSTLINLYCIKLGFGTMVNRIEFSCHYFGRFFCAQWFIYLLDFY